MLAMENQGIQPMAAMDPNSMEKQSGEVSHGHAPIIASHYHWPSSTQTTNSWNYGTSNGPLENVTPSASVHNYDPLRDSTSSEGTQAITSSIPQTTSSFNQSAACGSQAYPGYAPYSSSPYAYGYNNSQYQSNCYGLQHQAGFNTTSYNQVGASQISGASYQPHSSFQNTGSYATTPASYSGAYFANDHQTGYPAGGYYVQQSYWNDGNVGNYPLQYANYTPDTNSVPSTTSNPAASSYSYQWPVNYSSSVPTIQTAGYSVQSANGGTFYASSQPPPPGTTAWRGDLCHSTSFPTSQVHSDAIARFPHGGWEEKTPAAQNYHFNQLSSDMQKASDYKFPNHDGNAKTTSSYDPNSSLQVFSFIQTSQNPNKLPSQAISATDAFRASKTQIPANPRIASNLEASVASTVAKPAYISVQVPNLNNKLLSTDDTEAVKGAFPPSLCAYVERCFSRCKDDAQRAVNKHTLSEIIAKAKDDGTLWAKNWDMEPLFPLPNATSNGGTDQNILQGTLPLPKFPGRRSKSRWEPVAEESVDKAAPLIQDSTKYTNLAERMDGSRLFDSNIDNGRIGGKLPLPQQPILAKTLQRPLKKSRFLDSSNMSHNSNSSSDSDKEKELAKHSSFAIVLENSPEERKRREHRSKRFEKGQERHPDAKQNNMKGSGDKSIHVRRANAMLLAKISDVHSRAVEDIYWDALTVKGACYDVEKHYLRLTSAPDPATVRPEEVLEKALSMVQTSQKNYLYKCDQLKSIRQDLTVQWIRNELTAKVYETHGRLALEAGDMPEFNQCQSQLKRLYAEGIKGCQMEFSAYNLLCVILHSNNKRDILSSINSLTNEAKLDETVKHALAVHSAVSSGNYVLFFRLYKAASSLITCLMDLRVEKMRFEAMKCISKSYRPTVPVAYLAHVLGFSTSLQTGNDEQCVTNGSEECEEWLKAHGAVLVVENNAELQLDTKASSSSLYMPEPEDAVAHGDTNLAVDDFLTRTL